MGDVSLGIFCHNISTGRDFWTEYIVEECVQEELEEFVIGIVIVIAGRLVVWW